MPFFDSTAVAVLGWDSVVIESSSACFLVCFVLAWLGESCDFGECVPTPTLLPGDVYRIVRQLRFDSSHQSMAVRWCVHSHSLPQGVSCGDHGIGTRFSLLNPVKQFEITHKNKDPAGPLSFISWNYLLKVVPTECRSWQASMMRSAIACSAFFM